jgi:hypothetical protein
LWKESDKKLVVRLKSSPALLSLLLLMHLGAWGSVLVVPMPGYAKALLVVAVGISLRGSLLRHALRRGPRAVVELELQGEECALRLDTAPTWIPAVISAVFVHPWLVILYLRIRGGRSSLPVVILRRATDYGAFRELRVRLNAFSIASKPSAANVK